jgi:hypothetical protein
MFGSEIPSSRYVRAVFRVSGPGSYVAEGQTPDLTPQTRERVGLIGDSETLPCEYCLQPLQSVRKGKNIPTRIRSGLETLPPGGPLPKSFLTTVAQTQRTNPRYCIAPVFWIRRVEPQLMSYEASDMMLARLDKSRYSCDNRMQWPTSTI